MFQKAAQRFQEIDFLVFLVFKIYKFKIHQIRPRKSVDDAIDKLNRYFDNVFEKVIYFDGSKTAVFRPDSYMLLADVVLTFTKWTDDYRVDLRNPSILAKGISFGLIRTGRLLGFYRWFIASRGAWLR